MHRPLSRKDLADVLARQPNLPTHLRGLIEIGQCSLTDGDTTYTLAGSPSATRAARPLVTKTAAPVTTKTAAPESEDDREDREERERIAKQHAEANAAAKARREATPATPATPQAPKEPVGSATARLFDVPIDDETRSLFRAPLASKAPAKSSAEPPGTKTADAIFGGDR